MIIENERDERAAAWLLEKFGAEALAEAETRLKGSRRPYPGNLAKVLGGTPVREPETHRKRRSAPKTGRAAADVGRERRLRVFPASMKYPQNPNFVQFDLIDQNVVWVSDKFPCSCYTTFAPHVWHLSDFFGSFKQMFRQIDRRHGAII